MTFSQAAMMRRDNDAMTRRGESTMMFHSQMVMETEHRHRTAELSRAGRRFSFGKRR
jgi:hypothetical protein